MDILTPAIVVGCFLGAFVYLRWQTRRLLAYGEQKAAEMMHRMLTEALFESSEEPDGKGGTRRVLRPSPAVNAILDQLIPVLISKGLEWGKKNIKLAPGGGPGGPGGPGGALGPEALLNMVPKQYRGIASLLLPYAGKFLGGLQVGGSTETARTANPFMKEIETA